MPEIGQTISHFRLMEKIGGGGMGVVYKAEDTKLGRQVALKFLPDKFTGDPERMARFEREAKLLASLNHPNIAAIYGLEQADGKHFLNMEYVEGETLQARIGKGALPIEDALGVCRQIADGLEAAHEKGIIHRDLKPANVMITAEEKVKILDFGLAKALADESQSADSSQSPTITEAMTQPGVILGTAAYMSPEQAKGKTIDARADVWAFGCILFECLTGRRAFDGETTSEIVAAILRGDPVWKNLSPATPGKIVDLLHHCFRKDPNKRLHAIADARIEIDDIIHNPSLYVPGAPTIPRSQKRSLVTAIASLFIGICVGGFVFWQVKPDLATRSKNVSRYIIQLPDSERLARSQFQQQIGNELAISPDGMYLAFVAVSAETTRLFLRPLDKLESSLLAGTEGAFHPFFSPDSKWLGFFADGKMKKMHLPSGTPQVVCDVGPYPRGGTWGTDESIIFGNTNRGLSRVSSAGGIAEAITVPNADEGEVAHRWPELMPDCKTVIFTVFREEIIAGARLAALSLDTLEWKILLDEGGTNARFVSTGHLVYAQESMLKAAPFDSKQLRLLGPPIQIVNDVLVQAAVKGAGSAHYSISDNGALAYIPIGTETAAKTLVWVNHRGIEEPLAKEPRYYWCPRISSDGNKIAVRIGREGTLMDLYLYDILRGTHTRLTFEGDNWHPALDPDGNRLAFTSTQSGGWKLHMLTTDGSGGTEQLEFHSSDKHIADWLSQDARVKPEEPIISDYTHWPGSWSPDNKYLAFYEVNPHTLRDIWILSIEDKIAFPFLKSPFNERSPVFSPDGKWLAYNSDESGQFEVFIRAFPEASSKKQISANGGVEPVWAPDGKTIYYRNDDKVMAVEIEEGPPVTASPPNMLFRGQYFLYSYIPSYDIHPDGNRFLMVKIPEGPKNNQIKMVLNWSEELKQKVPIR